MKQWNVEHELRVNQAGEYGARRIYEGQLSILKKHPEIKHMLQQELEHLNYFNQQLQNRKIRPTMLQPLWHVGGYMLGKVTAMMGEKVPKRENEHARQQDRDLSERLQEALPAGGSIEAILGDKIRQFCAEEMEHRDHGLAKGAERAAGYGLLKMVISGITKAAISLSKRI